MPVLTLRRSWAALMVLAVTAFTFVSTELLPIGLLTVIADDLGRSRSQIGLLVGGYAIVVVLASLPLTALTRNVPRRRVLGATMVLFAAANLAGALAPSYEILAVARLVTALTQALFWSIAPPVVSGLFPTSMRGRVVALFSTGAALGPVLGVPLGTWLGQQAGWRAAFAVMAAAGLAATVAVVALIPTYPPGDGGAARGTAPDRRAFAVLLVAVAAGITGFLVFNTYVTPFLLDVSGFSDGALAPLLFVSGVAGTAGTIIVSRTLDAHPISSLLTPLAVGSASLLGLYLLGSLQVVTVVLLAGLGISFSSFATALQNRMLQVAPGNTDIASAGLSTAFNLGIAAGSLVGGALLPRYGAQPLAGVGAALTLGALVILLAPGARRGR
ncbi:MAG TPA: MFS transporter [Actinoplanes sp.]|jgi:DHA1 family L-arabinose/isopropyl-beta-D-thiogalactopyranoside export protein-like MFS transporter/DHA1 family inner membrane transport protein|nr:MFS transporter [Actinoplanes sp.]